MLMILLHSLHQVDAFHGDVERTGVGIEDTASGRGEQL
jgi:hypothetical protein